MTRKQGLGIASSSLKQGKTVRGSYNIFEKKTAFPSMSRNVRFFLCIPEVFFAKGKNKKKCSSSRNQSALRKISYFSSFLFYLCPLDIIFLKSYLFSTPDISFHHYSNCYKHQPMVILREGVQKHLFRQHVCSGGGAVSLIFSKK